MSAQRSGGGERARLLALVRTLCVLRGTFTLASGRTASVYLDVRRAALDADALALLGRALLDRVAAFAPPVDGVGGPIAGAVPLVASVLLASGARGRDMRGFMVRGEAKGHGAGRRVEGHLEKGQRVALVEDVVTSGGSVLRSVEAVREAGAEVAGVACVVDREEGGREALAAAGLPLEALFTLREVLSEDGFPD